MVRDFDTRTVGERWHEQVENEGFVKPLLVSVLAMAVVLFTVIMLGGELEVNRAEAEPIRFAEEVADIEGVEDGGYSGEPEPVPEEVPGDYVEESEQEGVYDYSEAVYEEYVYPVWEYTSVDETPYSDGEATGNLYFNGVEYDGGYRYTWYSQQVLPGGGLDIPGRHVDSEGYVRDEDGNLVLASSDLEYGTEVETPYGTGVVRDTGCSSGTLDVYTNWM